MVLELDASGAGSDAEAARIVAQGLRDAVARLEPFAAVIRMPPGAQRKRRVAGAAERVRLLRRLRPGLRDHCRGLAFVLPIEDQQANAKAIAAGAKLWGCPTTATADVETARTWASAQLAASRTERA
jgi:hypothetical protein